MTEHFYQRYVWFLSLLLLFFLVFAALYKLGAVKNRPGKTAPPWLALTVGGAGAIVPFAAVKLFAYQDILSSGWFSLGNVFQFQLGKAFIYAIYFALGVYGYANNWFEKNAKNAGLGKTRAWALALFSAFGINMLIFKNLSENSEPLIFKTAHVIFYPLWILTFIGALILFSFKYLNKSSKLSKSAAENSYNMYLAHYIFPFLLPLALRGFALPTLVKFGAVAVVTIAASCAASRIIRRFPKLTCAAVFAAGAALAVATGAV